MRSALRVVRDWSQRDASEHWNRRWPADPKTFKNFSYWELWPSSTGHAPSLDVLARLAELYECSAADLISDVGDYRRQDSVHRNSVPAAIASSHSNEVSDRAGGGYDQLLCGLDETADIEAVSRTLIEWADSAADGTSRRALLLQLSDALSMAAIASLLPAVSGSSVGAPAFELLPSGIWHSRYVYPSTGRGGDFTGSHYVVFRQQQRRLVGQSLPHSTGSQLRIELELEPPMATGYWREMTSPTGYYKGATYHGALQLVVDPSGRSMGGIWLGFGRDFTINTGRWDLTLEQSSASKNDRRRYQV